VARLVQVGLHLLGAVDDRHAAARARRRERQGVVVARADVLRVEVARGAVHQAHRLVLSGCLARLRRARREAASLALGQ